MTFIAGNIPPQISPSHIQKVQKQLDAEWNDETVKNTSETQPKSRVLPKYYKGNFKTKNAFNKFNNLFNKDENANKVKEITDYLKTGKIPEYIDVDNDTNATAKLNKFISDVDYFYLKDDRLYLKTWDLEVISKDKISQVLKYEYDFEDQGLGTSIVKFYKFIREKYLGITRNDIKVFLNEQGDYQIVKAFKSLSNIPVVSKSPNSVWCIDLLDMNYYLSDGNPKKQPKYIQNVLDLFSGKVWLRAVKTNSSQATTNALKSVIEKAKVTPKYLICDNGVEYKAEFETFCKEIFIKIRHTRTYSPQGNPVERYNQTARKVLRSFMLKYKSHEFTRFLDNVEDNMNESFIQSKKSIPNDLWLPTKDVQDVKELDLKNDEIGLAPMEQMKQRLSAKLMLHNQKLVKDYNDKNEFKTDDLVRIDMSSLYSNIRKLEKTGRGKLVIIKYTPEIFKIAEPFGKKQGLPRRKKYTLVSIDEKKSFYKPRLIEEKDKKGRKKVKYTRVSFWAKELLSAEGQDSKKKEMSLEQAMKLNNETIIKTGDLRDILLKTLPKRKQNQLAFIDEDDDNDDDVPPPELPPEPPKVAELLPEPARQSKRLRKEVPEAPKISRTQRTKPKLSDRYLGGAIHSTFDDKLKKLLLNNLLK